MRYDLFKATCLEISMMLKFEVLVGVSNVSFPWKYHCPLEAFEI